MFFVITSLYALTDSFSSYISLFKLQILENSWKENLGFLTYGSYSDLADDYNFDYKALDAYSLLAFGRFDNSKNFTTHPTSFKYNFGGLRNYLMFYELFASIVIYDHLENKLHLYSDIIGAHPIWFAWNRGTQRNNIDIIVSNDYIGIRRSGFTEITALGAGQYACLDVKTNSVFSMASRKKILFRQENKEILLSGDVGSYAMKLFSTAIDALDQSINGGSFYNITIEVDRSKDFSSLLRCSLDAVGAHRRERYVRAHVAEDKHKSYPLLASIIGKPISSSFDMRVESRLNNRLAYGRNTSIYR